MMILNNNDESIYSESYVSFHFWKFHEAAVLAVFHGQKPGDPVTEDCNQIVQTWYKLHTLPKLIYPLVI